MARGKRHEQELDIAAVDQLMVLHVMETMHADECLLLVESAGMTENDTVVLQVIGKMKHHCEMIFYVGAKRPNRRQNRPFRGSQGVYVLNDEEEGFV